MDMHQGECSTSGTVNVDEIVNSMRKGLDHYCSQDDMRREVSNSCIISKVSKQIVEVDRNSYEPIIVSIGPYHNGNPALQTMEREKWNCLDYILKINREKKLDDYLNGLVKVERQAKIHYQEGLDMDSCEFLRMMLLDGCFIIVSLYLLVDVLPRSDNARSVRKEEDCDIIISGGENVGANEKNIEYTTTEHANSMAGFVPEMELVSITTGEKSGLISTKEENTAQDKGSFDQIAKWHDSFMKHDLFLVENQIPFLIIWTIYDEFAGNKGTMPSLTESMCKFVENILHQYPIGIKETNRPKEFHHLLHLFHIYLQPSPETGQENECMVMPRFFNYFLHLGQRYTRLSYHPEKNKRSMLRNRSSCEKQFKYFLRWRQAVQYHEAGVVFKKKEYNRRDPHSLLDIRFNHGILEIPCLVIDQNTACLFRNLIAIEQNCTILGNDFNAYMAFMSRAMSTHNDVKLLMQKGIVVHQMRTDEEVSILFAKIGKNVDFDPNGRHYLRYVCQAMEDHYQNRVNWWMAWLWQNHFRNPWLSLAVLAGAVVLLCTLLQTWFSFLAFVKPTGEETSKS